MLSEDEASGYWGPGVFLNLGPDPTNTPHSITNRVAYWAGGIDTMEGGEPSIIPIKSLSELSTAVTKAACIQAMHKRGSHDVPLSATVDFGMLKPLIRGAPAILKPHLVAKRDEIKKDTEHNEGLGDNTQTAHKQLSTWADLMQGSVNYSRDMGWDDAPAEKQNLKPRGGDHKGGTAGHEVKKRVVSGRQLGLPVRKVEAYQWINDNGPYILIPVGPQRQLVKFLIDTGAQISLLTQQDAEKLGLRPRRQRVKITGVNGVSVQCQTAKVNLWLPGEKRMSSTRFAIKDHHENILGFDVLNGRTWRLPNGSVWSFGSNIDPNPSRNREAAVRALRAAPALPESKITNVPQYPLSAAARNGISEVIADLEKRQIISRTHSPYNSPVWPVRKPDGRWRLTVDYRRLNANTAPLTAAVPNIANLTATLQIAAPPWMTALDVKDMFFMVPLKEEDKEKFAFTWEGIQYTFNRLPQGYKHSPTIAHAALAELLQTVSLPQEVKLYQYIDDILIGGTSPEKVGEAAAAVWQALNKAEIEIPPGKCQGPSKEVKFLGTWWIAGSAVIPPDTLRKIEELQMPQSRKELQQLMGTLGYWRKHVPGFSIISRPLYSLLRKGKPWEWKLEHKEAVKTLTEELKTYQSLGPVHPRDPIIAEWGFAEHATYCNLFQTGPDGPKRPLLFSSTAFKETEQRYSEWEKGLLSLVRAVKQVEKIHQGQPVETRGPFNLPEAILKGTAPPEGVAQKPTVRKWYAYLTGVAENMQLTEGHTKVSKLQVPINTDPLALQQPFKPSPILDAAPLTEGTPTENIWFTDASAKRVNGKWQYKAVALDITTGKQVVEEGEGSAQVGEIRAVVLAAQNGAKIIYVDSYAVWAARKTPFKMGWVKAHAKDNQPATKWNQKVDELTKIRKITLNPEWYRLGEWLHQSLGHTGKEALYFAAQSKGWPINRKTCATILTECPQCRLKLQADHPAKAPPLHINEGKTLWSTWQIDYIRPFKSSAGYRYILTGVEVVSGLLMATKCRKADGQNTVRGLSVGFSNLPTPDVIQSDNGSHFSCKEVQDWAKQEGIRWVFHTPYYPQSNGMVERANGLLKRNLKPQEAQWDTRLPKVLHQLNNRYGPTGSPVSRAFFVKTELSAPPTRKREYPMTLQPGQPVMVNLPSIGTVPMTLTKPRGPLAWEATDSSGAKHRISSRWIFPSS
ncbi:hypothetical protein QYF61_019758 [Mycteria americana]|uniref:ribonuclease H n=1 Tax=Mycteria americana TaxID=33587 RepID=A0AAN7RNR6_MYCAM|nr:hypothetical protein QYF61_019758 [Mycteria americana]